MRKTLFTLLVMTGGLSSVVTAQTIPNGTYVIVSASDPMFAVTNSGNRKKPTNNTAIWPFLSDYSQIWRVENRNGKIVLHALNYDRYVIDNEGFQTENGNGISIYFDNNTQNQLWIPEKVGKDTYILRTSQNPNYVLDLARGGGYSGCSLMLWEYEPGEASQMWTFMPFPIYENSYHRDIPDGIYQIYPDTGGNDMFRLDNSGNNGIDGNNVHIWENFDNGAQKWRVENRNGGIVLHSMNNQRKVLDHEDFSTYNGNNVSIYEDNNTSNQLWFPEKVEDDTYVLRSSQNPFFVLDWGGGDLQNGSNVQLWEYIPGLDFQHWRFERIQ